MQFNVKDFSSIVTTSQLPDRVTEVISAAAIEQLKEIKNLRRLALIEKIDESATKYIYNTYSDLTDAYDRTEGADFKYDAASVSDTAIDIVEIAKGFQISWVAAKTPKLATQAAFTKACVQEVKDREDLKIAEALTASGALTTSVSANAALSETAADPIEDISEAVRGCMDLGYTPDTLLIENQNLQELMSIIGSNDWYSMTEKLVKGGELPSFMGLNVIALPSTKLSHGTAIVLKSGATGAIQIGQAHDVRLKIFDDNDNHTTKVQVYERIAVAISRPDAGAKINGW